MDVVFLVLLLDWDACVDHADVEKRGVLLAPDAFHIVHPELVPHDYMLVCECLLYPSTPLSEFLVLLRKRKALFSNG